MKYVSIDIETTGTVPHEHQILEFGAVLDDTDWWLTKKVEELPSIRLRFKYDTIRGEPFAIQMNHILIRDMAMMPDELCVPADLGPLFAQFLQANNFSTEINPAGKNFDTFDRPFLVANQSFLKHVRMRRRALDPALMYLQPTDEAVPGMEQCMKRAGFQYDHVLAHTAVYDAQCIVRLLRQSLGVEGWDLT